AVLRGPPRTGIIRSRDPGGDSKSFSRREMSDGRSAAETGCESPPRRPVKIASPFFARVKGVNVRASGPRERRRILRERHAAFQEKVREIGNSLGTEEASALRKAERQAQAQDDPGPQEDAAQAVGREAGDTLIGHSSGRGGDLDALEFPLVLRLISSLARTDPGRRAILGLTPASESPTIERLLAETSEAWEFRSLHGRLP